MLMQKIRADRFEGDSKPSGRNPHVLVVLDGWGVAPSWGGNAVTLAQTPVFNKLWQQYPSNTLFAAEKHVGLANGAAGNSEAGHLNIGAGRMVLQDQTIVDKQIENGEFFKKPALLETFSHVKKNSSTLHLMGLLSEAGTHSHINHLFALLECANRNEVKNIKIHLFSDGRDSNPMSGIEMLDKVERYIQNLGVGQVASVCGRYYAMDRDNHWGRTSRAYNALVSGQAETLSNARQIFAKSYAKGITDEFIEPKMIVNEHQEMGTIDDNDVIILFNFRPDRVKQLTMSFIADHIPEFPDRKKLKNIMFLSFTMYEQHYGHWPIYHIFTPDRVVDPLAKVISEHDLKQLHIAETEKYAHVTYFFNGGRDKPHPNEDWRLIPSPNVKTYNLTPHMSAEFVAAETVKALKEGLYDFYVVNFANPDMVGHTGNLKATVQAVTFVDKCLGLVCNAVLERQGTLYVTADHGNAEQMVNPTTGQPDTEHSTNPVPFIVVNKNLENSKAKVKNGRLCDIAPTILNLWSINPPTGMDQSNILFSKNG